MCFVAQLCRGECKSSSSKGDKTSSPNNATIGSLLGKFTYLQILLTAITQIEPFPAKRLDVYASKKFLTLPELLKGSDKKETLP